MKLAYATAAVAALMIGSSAQAAVTYHLDQFTSIQGLTGSLTFTTADFIKINTIVPSSLLSECTVTAPAGAACGATQTFYTDTSSLTSVGTDNYDAVSFNANNNTGAVDYFANGALQQIGVYDSLLFGNSQRSRLTITGAPGAVPEAATWAMMILGMGAIGASLRQRRQRTTVRFA